MSAGDWKEMYAAAQEGNLPLVRYHVENGVDPNYQHPEILSTPLVAAILAGQTEIALYLLQNKADPRLRSEFDNLTPWQAATQSRNEAILRHLREAGIGPHNHWLHRIKEFLRLSRS